MDMSLISEITSSVQKKAKDKVLVRYSLSLNKVLNANEIAVFKEHYFRDPIKEPVGLLAVVTDNTETPIDCIVSSIVANLVLSNVIENIDQVADIHITRKKALDSEVELFIFSIE